MSDVQCYLRNENARKNGVIIEKIGNQSNARRIPGRGAVDSSYRNQKSKNNAACAETATKIVPPQCQKEERKGPVSVVLMIVVSDTAPPLPLLLLLLVYMHPHKYHLLHILSLHTLVARNCSTSIQRIRSVLQPPSPRPTL